jgi:trans-2,3-dihydro-3-hydroxyanthranilate isomerase
MKQHVRLSDPIRLILEENVGPVTVDVAQRNGGFHGTLTLSGKIEAPSGAPSPTDLAAVLSIEPAEVSQVFFAGVGVPFCFAQLSSNEVVDRAAINRVAWAATLSRAWSPHVFFFAGNLQDGGKLYARMCAPALGVEEDPATGSACAALVGAMASKPDFGGMAYRLSIQQGVSMGRRSDIEAEARKRDGAVTSVSVGGATTYIASGEIEVPPFALERPRRGHRPAVSEGEKMLRNLFAATILAGPLAASAVAQAPDAACALFL